MSELSEPGLQSSLIEAGFRAMSSSVNPIKFGLNTYCRYIDLPVIGE